MEIVTRTTETRDGAHHAQISWRKQGGYRLLVYRKPEDGIVQNSDIITDKVYTSEVSAVNAMRRAINKLNNVNND